MQRMICLILVLVLSAGMTVLYAQSLEEILAKHHEVTGQEKLSKVNSLKVHAKV